jgi:hypothetical protein
VLVGWRPQPQCDCSVAYDWSGQVVRYSPCAFWHVANVPDDAGTTLIRARLVRHPAGRRDHGAPVPDGGRGRHRLDAGPPLVPVDGIKYVSLESSADRDRFGRWVRRTRAPRGADRDPAADGSAWAFHGLVCFGVGTSDSLPGRARGAQRAEVRRQSVDNRSTIRRYCPGWRPEHDPAVRRGTAIGSRPHLLDVVVVHMLWRRRLPPSVSAVSLDRVCSAGNAPSHGTSGGVSAVLAAARRVPRRPAADSRPGVAKWPVRHPRSR